VGEVVRKCTCKVVLLCVVGKCVGEVVRKCTCKVVLLCVVGKCVGPARY
jgi:hypothetical protein